MDSLVRSANSNCCVVEFYYGKVIFLLCLSLINYNMDAESKSGSKRS